MRRLLSAMIACTASLVATAAMAAEGTPIEYKDKTGMILEGYHFKSTCPETKDNAIVVHQWMGITEYEKMRGGLLADACYDVFLVDVYGKGVRPTSMTDAGKEATKYKSDAKLARTRMKAGLEQALKLSPSTAKPIVLGYCFGGTMALELARSGADVATIISFHGGLSTKAPARKGSFKANVIAHHGANDPLVPAEEVAAFKEEMNNANVKLTFYSYPGAVHAFTQKDAGDDASKGFAYNQEADELSWQRTLEYLGSAK